MAWLCGCGCRCVCSCTTLTAMRVHGCVLACDETWGQNKTKKTKRVHSFVHNYPRAELRGELIRNGRGYMETRPSVGVPSPRSLAFALVLAFALGFTTGLLLASTSLPPAFLFVPAFAIASSALRVVFAWSGGFTLRSAGT